MDINLTADVKVQPQGTDQDTVMLDGVTLESDVDIAQYAPPKSSTMSDVEAPYFTLRTTSNTLLELYNNFLVLSNRG